MREYFGRLKQKPSWQVGPEAKDKNPSVCMRLKTRSAETISGTARPFMRLLSASGETRWSQIEMIWNDKNNGKGGSH